MNSTGESTLGFVKTVWAYLREKDITPYALAKAAGMDNATVYDLIGSRPWDDLSEEDREYRRPTPENVFRLATAMEMSPIALFLAAYPKFGEDLRVSPQDYDFLARFQKLSEQEQELLLRAVRK